MQSSELDLDQCGRKGSILKHQAVVTTLSGEPFYDSLNAADKNPATTNRFRRNGKDPEVSCSTFPRSRNNRCVYFDLANKEDVISEGNDMEGSGDRSKVASLHDQLQLKSWETPELKSTHSLMGSPVSALPTDAQLRFSSNDRTRRGSDGLVTRGLKNRSTSLMIKLQVPPKNSPRKQYTTSTSDSQSSPDLRERAGTFSYSPSPRQKHKHVTSQSCLSASQKKDELEAADDEFSDDVLDISPMAARMSYTTLYPGKRNSILYLSDTDEHLISKPTSRASSISSPFCSVDEVYITPFAQILANLQHVRNQFITLTNPPISDERKRSIHWIATGELTDDEYKALSLATLDELDWCLHRLETVNSAKSMGTMAQDKFRRILSRELSHLSERSRSGHFVAEWVSNLTGSTQDYGDEIDKALDSLSMVQISQAQGTEPQQKTRSVSQVEPIPRFGIPPTNINSETLQMFLDSYLDRWEFDSFQLNFLTGSQPLVALGYTIFCHRGLFQEFKMSKTNFINFMTAVQTNYWPQNAFHNAIHAADVLHATNYLLKAEALENIFSDLEIMAALVSAAIHDVDHPGRNNQFLINTSHELAIMYNDESVLENHHLAVAFKLLKDPNCDFLKNLESAQMKAFRRMVIDNVLATDMSKHLQHLGELKTKVETKKVANEGILQLDKYSDRSEVLQCLLHCADLSNPTKPPDIASSWAYRIMEESFKQGDEEKKLGIDIGPLGDRDNVCVEKCQVSFIDFLIFPLWETWAELVYPDAQAILDNLAKTREYWSSRVIVSPLPTSEDEKDHKTSDSGISNTDVEVTLVNGTAESEDTLLSPVSITEASLRRDSYKATRNAKEIDGSLPQTDS